MSQEARLINGDLLRLRREAQGWVVTDMALRACLSVKQVRQLEEGGTSAFYSESVKVTAAKKVGSLLGLSADEVFVSSTTPLVEQEVPAQEASAVDAHHAINTEAESGIDQIAESVSVSPSVAVTSELPANEEAKPKTSVWAIAGLFAAALAVAAYMQPKEDAPIEAAPPLQAVPSEAEAAASAAEASASSASAVSDPVAPEAQKTASPSAMPASAVAPVASAARAPSVAASSATVRPVSGVLPAASAASKAP